MRRHQRRADFDAAVLRAAAAPSGERWHDLAPDPNAAEAVAARASTLRAAWRPPVVDRIAFLEDRCRGRRVLDIGCVAHDVARMRSPQWLHGRLAAVAGRCTGVDVLDEGVAAMRELGYHAFAYDLRDGLGPLAEEAPYDVIVAGELVEHLPATDMLFEVAAAALAGDGELILTTPNPYAPHRVRAGQLGLVWENVDHVVYAFPSGVAELAERNGLVLAEAMVVTDRSRPRLVDRLKELRRRLWGTHWVNVGFATSDTCRVRRVDFGPVGRAVRGMAWPRRPFVGETFIYAVRRPPA